MLRLKFSHLFLDIDIDIADSFAILGPNGSGKSILLRVISHELYPRKLEIREVFGKKLTLSEARKTFGIVDGNLEYFYRNENVTVYDAVISAFKNALVVYDYFSFSDKQKEAALSVIEKFSLNPQAFSANLSLGEIKKMLIARAIVHNPKILCLDEPTNGLDIKAKVEFWELIEKLDMKTILVTHDFYEVKSYSNIIMLSRGRAKVIKELKKEDIIKLFEIDENIYRRFYG